MLVRDLQIIDLKSHGFENPNHLCFQITNLEEQSNTRVRPPGLTNIGSGFTNADNAGRDLQSRPKEIWILNPMPFTSRLQICKSSLILASDLPACNG